MASSAIWWPKLDETFFVPLAYAPSCVLRSCDSADCFAPLSDFVRICHCL
jgi:hypothetical protein